MKIATIIARVLLGLIFVVFVSNAFLHFLPMPPLPHGVAGEYLHAFFASGYVYVSFQEFIIAAVAVIT
jgi:putative oxidoreductase